MRNRFVLCRPAVVVTVAVVAAAFASPTARSADEPARGQQQERQDVVRSMARELLAGLNPKVEATPLETGVEKTLKEQLVDSAWKLKQWWRDERAPESSPKNRRLALWPFWKEESVVAEDFAEMLSDSLLAELIRHKGATDTYVAREDLKLVIRDIDDFNQLRQSSEKIGSLIREAGADVLIIGEVKPETDGRTVFVRYRATSVSDGSIAATTDWHRLRYDFDRTPTMAVSEAVTRSARHFRDRLEPLRIVRPQGIRFADSGVQTPFGKWFSSRLVGELQRLAGEDGRSIGVADAIVPAEKLGVRGLKLASKAGEKEMAGSPTGDYVLRGRYWLLGEKVDLQLEMTDGAGRTLAWQGDIRAGTVDLPLKPVKSAAAERETDNLGPVALHIGSARGVDPVYRVGQRLVLFVEASRDSHLYCFYRQADGMVMRIFPNRFHKGSFIEGGELQDVPSLDMSFDWVIAKPTGTELVKCYAFDREVWKELPPAIRAADFTALPYRSVEALTADLRRIPRVGIAETSMVVNVEE